MIARTFVVSCRSARRVHRPPFGRMTRHAAILACLAMLPVSPAARAGGRAPAAPCAAAPSENDAIEAVSPQGEIKLASGRFAKLEGIRLAEGEHHEQALAWLNAHVGRHVSVAARRRDSDRWGRVPASVVLADRPVRLDLAQGLVDLGLAVADAGEADAFCAPELLALESAAGSRVLVFGRRTAISPRRPPTRHVFERWLAGSPSWKDASAASASVSSARI